MFEVIKPTLARSFTPSAQYLEHGANPITSGSLSMACWFLTSDTTNDMTLMGVQRSSSFERSASLLAGGARVGDPVVARGFNGSAVEALSTTGYLANGWNHAVGVWSATGVDLTQVWLNAGSRGINASNGTGIALANRICIGRSIVSGNTTWPMNGLIVWPAIWKEALSFPEVARLASGVPPWMIRPEALVAFWDWTGAATEYTSRNLSPGAYQLTNNGTVPVNGPAFLRTQQKANRFYLAQNPPASTGNRRRRLLTGAVY